jgi:hypothetical protein
MTTENVIKFNDEEMQQIAELQAKYQQKIFDLGQNELAYIDTKQQLEDIENIKKQILEAWTDIQKEETALLKSLSDKYGDGVLNIKDGTFKPSTAQ